MFRSRSWFVLLAAALLTLTAAALSTDPANAGEPVLITLPSPYNPYSPPVLPAPCLPGHPVPAPLPGVPGAPGAPSQPGQPPTPGAGSQGAAPLPGQTDPTQPATPGDGTSALGQEAQAAQAGEAGTAAAASFNPTMFGDLIGMRRFRRIVVPQRQIAGENTATSQAEAEARARAARQTRSISVASFTANAFKITENDSPRPTNRVFASFHYFNDVNGPINPPGFGTANLYRETIGFERTFLDGNASFAMRLPFAQDTGPRSIIENTFVGDLNLIFKYALYNDPSGDVFSTGLVLTLPTGPSFEIPGESDLHPVLFQPWAGYIVNIGRTYLQGFFSVVVPTDMRDATVMFNDLAIGYQMYRSANPDAILTAVTPQFELHVNTPLSHRGTDSGLTGFPDMVNLTGGVIFQLYGRATLGMAAGTPTAGPKPWAFEALSYFNLYF